MGETGRWENLGWRTRSGHRLDLMSKYELIFYGRSTRLQMHLLVISRIYNRENLEIKRHSILFTSLLKMNRSHIVESSHGNSRHLCAIWISGHPVNGWFLHGVLQRSSGGWDGGKLPRRVKINTRCARPLLPTCWQCHTVRRLQRIVSGIIHQVAARLSPVHRCGSFVARGSCPLSPYDDLVLEFGNDLQRYAVTLSHGVVQIILT